MRRTEQAPGMRPAAGDRARLERARRGDAAAFDAVVTTRLPAAFQLACAILGPDRDPDDAATCAMVAAWHELPRLEDLDRFDDWLDRIVISECRMRLGRPGSGAAAPVTMRADLPERTMRAVRERPRRVERRGRRTVFGAGLAIAVPVLVVGALALGGAFNGLAVSRSGAPGPSAAALAPGGSGLASPVGQPTRTASPSGATPPSTAGTPDGLAPGALAVVTLEGNNLRVRKAPGVGDPASRLKPLLPAGTRMLVVDGPVSVDGLDWYEIQTDGELIDLFGWVAAGDNRDDWITPAAPRCWGDLGAATVAGLDRIDFLACYDRAEVKVRARAADLWDAHGKSGDCGWMRAGGTCNVDNAWLLLPAAPVTLVTDTGAEHDVVLAMPPDLSAALVKLPRQSTLLLTVSMDAPEAAACHATDATTGATLIPDDRAVTACRLQFVVQEVAFRDPGGAGASEPPGN